jgi:VanZ family protein
MSVRLLRLGYWGIVLVVFVLAVAPIHEVGPEGSDKLDHFAAFFVLGAGAGLLYPRQPLWLTLGLAIAYGGLIELVQALPIVNRDCDIYDWLTDILGVGVAAAAIVLSGLRGRLRLSKSDT